MTVGCWTYICFGTIQANFQILFCFLNYWFFLVLALNWFLCLLANYSLVYMHKPGLAPAGLLINLLYAFPTVPTSPPPKSVKTPVWLNLAHWSNRPIKAMKESNAFRCGNQLQSFSKVICEGNVVISELYPANTRTHSLFQHGNLVLQTAVPEGRWLLDALQGKELPCQPLLHQENFWKSSST